MRGVYASSSPHENAGLVAVIGMRPGVPVLYPSVSDLRQNDCAGPNDSISIDKAIKKTLRDPDSFNFISATLWTQDLVSYGPKAWICQAEYRVKNGLGGFGLPEEAAIIFDADGCRVLNPLREKKPDAMSDSERKRLMYTVKTIHDPLANAQ